MKSSIQRMRREGGEVLEGELSLWTGLLVSRVCALFARTSNYREGPRNRATLAPGLDAWLHRSSADPVPRLGTGPRSPLSARESSTINPKDASLYDPGEPEWRREELHGSSPGRGPDAPDVFRFTRVDVPLGDKVTTPSLGPRRSTRLAVSLAETMR
jgi:hypothetical protein